MKILLTLLLVTLTLLSAPRTGDAEVSFKLPNLYDNQKSLASESLRGKVVLLNLWASWCGGCQEEMPLFVKLQKEYAKKNFEIVLSSIDNESANSISFLKEVDKERVLTALFDKEKELPKAYRCPGMPSSFLIDKEGKIAAVYIGSLDDAGMKQLKAKIQELLGK